MLDRIPAGYDMDPGRDFNNYNGMSCQENLLPDSLTESSRRCQHFSFCGCTSPLGVMDGATYIVSWCEELVDRFAFRTL
jgi:hypothetical protein